MIDILLEVVLPALRGDRAGARVRIKPSWSGRVYGTYSITGRHFLLTVVFLLSSTSLFGRLVALNMAQPALDTELATLRLCTARERANRAVLFPARTESVGERAESFYSQSHMLETILGLPTQVDPAVGVGNMEAFDDRRRNNDDDTLRRLEVETGFLEQSFSRLDKELTLREDELRFTPSVVPIGEAEFVPTSPYGHRISPFTRRAELHRGVDFAADMNSDIVATADGTVVHVERNPNKNGMGIYLVIDHDGRFLTYYGHCSRIYVEVGEEVRRHQLIAEVGSTGRSTGPHVHYEIRRSGKSLNPRSFMLLDPRFQHESQIRFD